MLRNRNGRGERRGIILLVVMAMLALFASVALSFVFYAEAEATTARYARQAEGALQPDVEPELLMNYALGQLIYDTDNEFSALRGHGLARLLYGSDPTRSGKNGYPFNGAGVLRYNHTKGPWAGGSNERFINYTNHQQVDGFVRDPEYYGLRGEPDYRFAGGANVPWTYPGLNNVLLAAVNANGEVLIQSGHRPFNGANFGGNNAFDKYLTLRPHKSYHTSFEDPPDQGGDVKNLPLGKGFKIGAGVYANNDSYWMDLGFPVLTAPNGRKYKPLFAFLVIDLDGRVNLQVAGNIKNGGNHGSNQGWGRWEINLGKVIPSGEANSLIQNYRYGGGGPNYPVAAAAAQAPFYSRFDFDATPGGNPTLPTAKFFGFPTFPGGWDGRTATEVPQHPAGFNVLNPGAPNKRMPILNQEAFLRYGGKNSPSTLSELFTQLPTGSGNQRARNLTTLLSMDFDRPGLLPYLPYDSSSGNTSYTWTAPTPPYPRTAVQTFPDPATFTFPASEFQGQTFSSKLALANRIDLARDLGSYPGLDADGLMDTTGAPYQKAVKDRERFADDIFKMLLSLTGAKNPASTPLDAMANPQDFATTQYLAQLAVNIVDYIDEDAIMTAYCWQKDGGIPKDWVFGTELPAVVLNEAYAQVDVDPEDPDMKDPDPAKRKASYYRLTSWVELHNPLKDTTASMDPFPTANGRAVLKYPGNVAYQVVLSKPEPDLALSTNVTGETKKAYKKFVDNTKDCVVDDWDDPTPVAKTREVLPPSDPDRFAGANGENDGFYVLGPRLTGDAAKDWVPGRAPFGMTITTFKHQGMAAKLTKMEFADIQANPNLTILLRRLANPNLPHDPTPTNPTYNPYVTVDYLSNVKINDVRSHNDIEPIMNPPEIKNAVATGRRQPYAADPAQVVDQNPLTPVMGEPKHTLFRQNCQEDTAAAFDPAAMGQTIKSPFDWLVHLDRKPVNPLELIHVSGYRPHELTRKFVSGGLVHQHVAPWVVRATDATAHESLLYRFLELSYVPDQTVNAPRGGRTPGKININTIWDREVFEALVDPQPADAAIFNQLWADLQASRNGPDGTGINGDDLPFTPLSTGWTAPGTQYANGAGIDNTILRKHPMAVGQRLFEIPSESHPYLKNRLLQKIFNNTTTRSNCFAVWCTVGFFEVTDETASPPKLGKEIGKDDNRHIRHKFFAIIDRTNVRTRFAASTGAELNFNLANAVTVVDENMPVAGSLTINGTSNPTFDTLYGGKFTIGVGSVITISPNTSLEERVTVDSVTVNAGAPSVTFNFQMRKSHNAGDAVIFRCHPGPQPRYDVRKDGEVVPHYSVIE